jgi:hypothetical protein
MRAPSSRPWMPAPRLPRVSPRAICAARALVAACLVLGPGTAGATEPESEIERFVPSFSFYFDTLGQRAEAAIESSEVLGTPISTGGCLVQVLPGLPPFPNGSVCPGSNLVLQPNQQGDDTNVVPMVGASIELMTPALLENWLRPRLFAHVDLSATFGFERNLAGSEKPGEMVIPPLPAQFQNTNERVVTGQGTRAKQQTKRWMLSGGAGFAFTTEVFRRTVRIKPSFEFVREEIDLIGAVHRAVALRSPASLSIDDYRLVRLATDSTETLYGLGPGLELEVDTVATGPVMLSVYASGRGYRFIGHLHTTLVASNESGETATFRFENEPWAWRGGIGLRFRLVD